MGGAERAGAAGGDKDSEEAPARDPDAFRNSKRTDIESGSEHRHTYTKLMTRTRGGREGGHSQGRGGGAGDDEEGNDSTKRGDALFVQSDDAAESHTLASPKKVNTQRENRSITASTAALVYQQT